MLKLKRKTLTLTADNEIGLSAVDFSDSNAVATWGIGMLMGLSVTAGVLLLVSDTPLGVYASPLAVGFIVGGFAVGLTLIGNISAGFFQWRDERKAQSHIHTLAALKRRQLSIQVSTVDLAPKAKPTVINYANGTQEVIEPQAPTLIDPAAAELKAQAIKWLSDSESKRLPKDRADRICRFDKMGWSPDAWTRARDSLIPFVESNPVNHPKGTFCVAAEFMTVETLLAGVEDGQVLPSPTGAVWLKQVQPT